MKRYLEILVPGCGPRRYPLADTPLSIGSGRGAGLALTHATQLQDQHLELKVESNGCRIEVCAGVAAVVHYDGQASRVHLVPWGADAFVEGVRLTPLESDAQNYAGLVLLTLGLAGVPAIIITFANLGGVMGLADPAPPAPELFEKSAGSCSLPNPELATNRAVRAELEARARLESYAFKTSDGLAALALFREASACYRAGSDAAAVARVERDLQRWRVRLEQEYNTHQLRLAMALEHRATSQALHEIAKLKAFLTRAERGPFLAWLSRQERRLTRGSR